MSDVERDAARYRYIAARVRKVDVGNDGGGWSGDYKLPSFPAYRRSPWDHDHGQGCEHETFDAAIDAAMKK